MVEATFDVGRVGFLICPVRHIEPEEEKQIVRYLEDQEKIYGWKMHYPPRDTHQEDPIGLNIITENRAAIKASTAVHVWYNQLSEGSRFDWGMMFAFEKPVILANPQTTAAYAKQGEKSFANILLVLGLVRREPDGAYVRLRAEIPASALPRTGF